MQSKKKNLANPCEEKWESMKGDDQLRLCYKCKKNVRDVSDLSLQEISNDFIDSEKCVKMSSEQTQFFRSIRSLSKAAGISAALSFFPFSSIQAQDHDSLTEYCLIYGKVNSNIISNRNIYVVVDGQTFETRTAEHGTFKLKIPKGEKIEDSNIRRIKHKTIDEDYIRLKRVKLPKGNHFIGTPSF